MRQELRFFRSEKAIEIEADGKVIATLPMITTPEPEPESKPEPAPEPKAIGCDFKTWNPQVTKSRLVEPTMDTWAVLHGVSENRQSINSPENVSNPEGILTLWNRQKTAVIEGETMTFTTACVYSQKLFGKGRIDIRANLACAMDTKNTIWATTSPMTDPRSGLKYLFEFDIVEYTPADTGRNNTSRGLWVWQDNKQSVDPATRLPYIDFAEKTSYSPGRWWWTGKAWYQWTLCPVCINGNRLRGTNGKYYFVTNRGRGVNIDSQDLTWVREDGVEGKGLDGNKYFVADSIPIGGAVKSTFLDGKTPVGGWHTWSVIVEDDHIAYECDGREYYRITNEDLHGLIIQDGISFNLIFTNPHLNVQNVTGEQKMEIEKVTYTPIK